MTPRRGTDVARQRAWPGLGPSIRKPRFLSDLSA